MFLTMEVSGNHFRAPYMAQHSPQYVYVFLPENGFQRPHGTLYSHRWETTYNNENPMPTMHSTIPLPQSQIHRFKKPTPTAHQKTNLGMDPNGSLADGVPQGPIHYRSICNSITITWCWHVPCVQACEFTS